MTCHFNPSLIFYSLIFWSSNSFNNQVGQRVRIANLGLGLGNRGKLNTNWMVYHMFLRRNRETILFLDPNLSFALGSWHSIGLKRWLTALFIIVNGAQSRRFCIRSIKRGKRANLQRTSFVHCVDLQSTSGPHADPVVRFHNNVCWWMISLILVFG